MDLSRVYGMKLQKVYPLWVQKAKRKGRTQEEVDEILCWLTGYSPDALQMQVDGDGDLAAFFGGAPAPNDDRLLIRGVVCGVRVETIEDPLYRNIRLADKLIDELAKGKSLEKIFRLTSR